MDIAVTLICNPAQPALNAQLLDDVASAMGKAGASDIRRTCLAADIAEDFLFDCETATSAWNTIAARIIGDKPIDIAVQPAARRAKRLLIADMDSTIIEQECIDELAEFAGLRAEISAITERAMAGALDFEDALRARVKMLAGLSETVLEQTFRDRISLTSGARTLVQTMKKRGCVTALVSGGFTYFTERVAHAAGFEHSQANTLNVANGALTGEVGEPILGRAAKENALRRIAGDNAIDLKQTLAVGDGANDLAMLKAAGLGVAFRAKPTVADAADIGIDHGDLTALLFLQGIPQSEFVE